MLFPRAAFKPNQYEQLSAATHQLQRRGWLHFTKVLHFKTTEFSEVLSFSDFTIQTLRFGFILLLLSVLFFFSLSTYPIKYNKIE